MAPRALMMVGFEGDMTYPPEFSSLRMVASTLDRTSGLVAEL